MALIDARVLRSLTVKESKGDKQTRQYSASEEFLILADAKDPSFGDILADETSWTNLGNAKLPQLDDKVTLNGVTFYVSGRDLKHYKDNERAVVMTVRYDAKDEADDEEPDPPQGTDPETWLRISVQTQQMTEPASGWVTFNRAVAAGPDEDFARNSAGDPVDGLEEDTAMTRLTYSNTQVLNPNFQQLQQYVNTCNSVDFLGGGEYTIRCMGWSGEYDQKNNRWTISVEFLYKPNGWQIEFYDVGFNEIISGKRRAILDLAGNPISKPVPLDGNGQAVPIDPGGGDEEENFQPLPLTTRYLYPYKAVDLRNLTRDCRI